MIYERDYMRDPERHRITAAVALLWILGGCFVVQSILWVYGGTDLVAPLGLSLAGVLSGRVWQLVTYQFLHVVPWPFHVLFNCLGLYFFGRSVEERLGTRNFLLFYFGGAVVGGLLQLGLQFVLRDSHAGSVVGASAGVCALIASYCRLFQEREISFILTFLPVTLRARTLLWILTGLSLWGALFPYDTTAHAAHLGGIAVGYFGVGALDPEGWLASWRERRVQQRRVQHIPVRPRPEPMLPPEMGGDFVSREVDPILDKIAAKGFQSLTEAEKRTLEAARKRISRR